MARALIVTDEEFTAGFVRSALEEAGHTVIVAPSVEEAYHRLRDEHIEILLADLHIPECQNPELLALWREKFHDLKILALSAPETVANFLALRMMGAQDVLQKPVGLRELLHAVQVALHEEP